MSFGNAFLTKPSSRRTKTVVRAIRLTEELDQNLMADADSKGITVGSLISSIFTRYVTFDKHTQSMGSVVMPQEWFSHLLDATSEESFKKYYPIMQEEWRSRIEFASGQRLTFQNYWKWLELVGSYNIGLFRCNAIRSDERRFSLTLYHTYSQKWSDFLENAVANILTGLGVRIQSHSSTPSSVAISGETT